MRLSTAVAESPAINPNELERLREHDLNDDERSNLVNELADRCLCDTFLRDIELDLLRAMLLLQCDHPGIRRRVMKYLRGEDLHEADRKKLAGLVPQSTDEGAVRLIEWIAKLMDDVQNCALVLCVDQLEDMFRASEQKQNFIRAMQTVRGISENIPSSIVIISCLEDYYDTLSNSLDLSLRDRVERDPAPIKLAAKPTYEEIESIVRKHLEYLYDHFEAAIDETDPVYPIPLQKLLNRALGRTRDFIQVCRDFHEQSVKAGKIVDHLDPIGPPPVIKPVTDIEQVWNDFVNQHTESVDDESELAELFAKAIEYCNDELFTGHRFTTDVDGRHIVVNVEGGEGSVLQIGVCNRRPQNNGLKNQVDEVVERSRQHHRLSTPVLLRSTEYPSNPQTNIAKYLGQFISNRGRRVVVADADVRVMSAMRKFRLQHIQNPDFVTWLQRTRPLSHLKSLRDALELEDLEPLKPAAVDPPPPPPEQKQPTTEPVEMVVPPNPQPRPPAPPSLVYVGTSNDRAARPVEVPPDLFCRHAAFLGGAGSGKTTAAMNVIEQLLLQKIPAILIDRKGDLCAYARESVWTTAIDDEKLSERQQRLRDEVEIAVYTPGHPDGRNVAMPIVPPGVHELRTFEREQIARQAANSLGWMLGYTTNNYRAHIAVMAAAIEILSQESGAKLTVHELLEFIDQRDPGLINAIGVMRPKIFDRLILDLGVLAFNKKAVFPEDGEPLDANHLFGFDENGNGKTRLSIISTKFLGDIKDVQFWVSQLLMELGRWMSKRPRRNLQAVVMLDEADIYLPATSKPSTKEPLENLLKRARSGGLGVFLATQSPGDFDYKCRDNITTWFIGRVREDTAIQKMKPMLSDYRIDISSKLATQKTGEFFLVQSGDVVAIKSSRAVVETDQLPECEIVELAAT